MIDNPLSELGDMIDGVLSMYRKFARAIRLNTETFTPARNEAIRAAYEQGDLVKAQKIILDSIKANERNERT